MSEAPSTGIPVRTGDQSLAEAVAAAAASQQDAIDALAASTSDGTADFIAEAMGEDASATPTASEGEGGTDVGSEVTTDDGSAEGASATADEPPTEYFGVDLSDLSAEARQRVIDGYKERDRQISRVMQENAELRRSPADVGTGQAAPTEITDEQVLAALKLDPNDPMTEIIGPALLPLAKDLLSTKANLNTVMEDLTVQKAAAQWDSRLTALEAEYGKLPVGWDELVDFAYEKGIFTPDEAYHAFMGPGRAEIARAAAAERAAQVEALKKTQQGATRPRATAPTRAADDAEGATSVADAIRRSILAQTRRGEIDWTALTSEASN